MRARDLEAAIKNKTPLGVRTVPGGSYVGKVYVTGGGSGLWTATSDPDHREPAKIFDPRMYDVKFKSYGAWTTDIPSIRFLGEWEEACRMMETERKARARESLLRGEREAAALQKMTDLATDVRELLRREDLQVYPDSDFVRGETKYYVRIEPNGFSDA